MKKILLLVLLSSTCLFAQEKRNNELPQIIPTSPSVATLMRFEEVPVNQYSGVPDIAIPLVNKNVAKNINLNIGLRYNASGVRIDERSGWTGTGWSLNAGGVISRTVVGLPDEKNIPGTGKGILHNDYFDFPFTNTNPSYLNEFLWKSVKGKETYDSQIDLYQFSFFGNSGRFVIVKDEYGNLEPKILALDQKLKIELFYDQSTYVIDKFEVTDQHGVIYTFGEEAKEQTISSPLVSTSLQGTGGSSGLSIGGATEEMYTSAWKLKNVKTSNSILISEFEYEDVLEKFKTPENIINKTFDRYSSARNVYMNDNVYGGYNSGLFEPKSVSSSSALTISSKKLKRIILTREQTKIDFENIIGHPEYDLSLIPQMVNTGCKLSKISVLDKNNLVTEVYNFNYSNNTTGNRLFLDNINYVKGAITLPYNFYYKDKNILPGFGDNRKDRWGYYNHENTNHSIKQRKGSVDILKIDTGVLNKIEYPTGGFKEFEFESNAFSYLGSELVDVYTIPENHNITGINGVFTHSITDVSPSANQDLKLIYIKDPSAIAAVKINSITNHSSDLDKLDHFFLKVTPVEVKSSFGFDPNCVGNCPIPYLREHFETPNYDLRNEYNITIPLHDNVGLTQGWYFVETSGIDFFPEGDGIVEIDFSVDYSIFTLNQNFMYGGGVRVKEVKFNDDNIVKSSTKYEYNNFNNEDLSSGSFDGELDATPYKISRAVTVIVQIAGGQVMIPVLGVYDVQRIKNPLNVQMTKGNYIGYQNVSVIKENNGKTNYTFISPKDEPTFQSHLATYPFVPQPDLDFKRGLMTLKQVYKNNGEILSQKKNSYNVTSHQVAKSILISEDQFGGCASDQFYSFYDSNLGVSIDNFPPPQSNGQPTIVVGHGYCDANSYIGGQNYFYYAGKSELMKSETHDYFYDILGNQHTVKKVEHFTYSDYNNLMTSQVVEINENQNTTQIGEHYRTEYKYPNSYTSPAYSTQEQAAISRLDDVHNINEVVATSSYKDGVLLGVSQNAYKEFETNLILPSKSQVSKGLGVPVDRLTYYKYDTYGNPLEVSKKDGTKISYIWGYSQTKPVAKIEGASYVEIATALGVTEVQLLAFNELNLTQINSLRTSLPKAMTSTYTYELLVGITSSTDARGYITTYIYDDFNRLKQVKDANGNILSESEYNYKNQN